MNLTRSTLIGLAVLGAFHGLNPAMGWLFAVARGMQEGSRREVVRSLWPIALGHELAVGLAVAVVAGLELVVAPVALKVAGAAVLIGYGAFKLAKPLKGHPRYGGMRVGRLGLVVWSFLMSSAHGAGLMLFPVLAGRAPRVPAGALGRVTAAGLMPALGQAPVVLTVHVAAMLVMMGGVAVVVYDHVGVGVLRRAWVNLDAVWAVALIVAGVASLFT